MPSTLRLLDGTYQRQIDVQRICETIYTGHCVEITGFSNIGKSALMRLISRSDVWQRELGEAGSEFLPVYIDCNRMLEMTGQGFYELVLRCLLESSEELAQSEPLRTAYETLITPESDLVVPLSFSQGLTSALQIQRKLVLLFDEFDEPFSQIESRVFLNLRAKKDRHLEELVYVTATDRPLLELRPEDHCGEFCELFNHQHWHLAPLTHHDVTRFMRDYSERFEVDMTHEDIDFVYLWSGGHPGMLLRISRILTEKIGEAGDSTDRWSLHRKMGPDLRSDRMLTSESAKIWQQCEGEERETLLQIFAGKSAEKSVVDQLLEQHILFEVDGKRRAFGRAFSSYIQDQAHVIVKGKRLWVDLDGGEVYVDGKTVETLTKLEYQLMLLLYENADKIVDKYQIVSGVWGEAYIDEVDDARIEKLVSRLRQKIEPDPSSPRFLTTVRGRGYRLLQI